MKIFNFISVLLVILHLSSSCTQLKRSAQQEENPLVLDSIPYVKKAEISDYSAYASNVLTDGFVSKEQTALQIAEAILVPIYGSKNIYNQRPYVISLKDSIWIIEGYLPQGADGGVFHIEINKYSGEILKVVHTK